MSLNGDSADLRLSLAEARAAERAYQRQMLEGDDDAEEGADFVAAEMPPLYGNVPPRAGSSWGSRISSSSASHMLSSEEVIRSHQQALLLNSDELYPLSASPSSDKIGGVPLNTGFRRPEVDTSSKSRFTPRCRLIATVSCGCFLILFVLIFFVVAVTRHLNAHISKWVPGDPNAFRMQLLGQSVLRFDVLAADQQAGGPNGTFGVRAAQWQADWARTLTGDFVLCDLETSLTGPFGGVETRGAGSLFSHIAPPSTLDLLTSMGINTWVCANNHQWDLGMAGLLNLFLALAGRGIACAGVGLDRGSAAAAHVTNDKHGLGVSLGIVAMASGSVNTSAIAGPAPMGPAGVNVLRLNNDGTLNSFDVSVAQAAVAGALQNSDIDLLAVYEHNHYALANTSADPALVDPWRVQFAHSMIDAGASMYFSHGVPEVQAIEIYNYRPIFYGLGNFIFQSRAPAGFWPNDSYTGVMVDAGWGCRSCSRNRPVPVTSLPPETGADDTSASDHFVREAPSEEDVREQQWTGATRMPVDADTEAQPELLDGEAPVPPVGSSNWRASVQGTGVPSPTNPVPGALCRCGYRLSTLLLRPMAMVLPLDAFDTLPTSMQFNNSFGLPTLRMPKDQARAVLERVAQLSAKFGTRMEIVEAVGEEAEGPDVGDGPEALNDRMRSNVFARVQLAQLKDELGDAPIPTKPKPPVTPVV